MARYTQFKDLPIWNRALDLSKLSRTVVQGLRDHAAEVREELVKARDRLRAEQEACLEGRTPPVNGRLVANGDKASASSSEAPLPASYEAVTEVSGDTK